MTDFTVASDIDDFMTAADADAALVALGCTSYILTLLDDADAATALATLGAASSASLSAHTSNTSNPHSVSKSQVGLSSVDNTSDADKPVSTAQQAALDLKLAASAVSAYGLTLVDDANASAARSTLGLGSAATSDTGDFATSAQGSTADSALQSASNLDDVGDAADCPV